MYIYHALINALDAHMLHIKLNMMFYTHVKHSPTKTIYIKYLFIFNFKKIKNALQTHTHRQQWVSTWRTESFSVCADYLTSVDIVTDSVFVDG